MNKKDGGIGNQKLDEVDKMFIIEMVMEAHQRRSHIMGHNY